MLPPDVRIALLKVVVSSYGGSIQRAAREVGISRMQVYRYVAGGVRQPTPSTATANKVLRAAMRVDPATTRLYLKNLASAIARLVESL